MNLLRRLVPGAFLAVALVWCGTTWADDNEKPRRPQFGGPGRGQMSLTLVSTELAEKLKLTTEQKTKIEKLQKEFEDKNKDTFDKAREAMRKAFQDMDREAMTKIREQMDTVRKARGEYQDKIAALLTGDQKKTFEENKNPTPPNPFQGGPGGRRPQEIPGKLLSSSVQEKLNLTAEQKEKLAKMQKDFETKALEMLTDEQKKKLEDLKKEATQQGPRPPRPNPNQ
jgi:Spy/CpxP family protein refolding chaperone